MEKEGKENSRYTELFSGRVRVCTRVLMDSGKLESKILVYRDGWGYSGYHGGPWNCRTEVIESGDLDKYHKRKVDEVRERFKSLQ